MVTYISKQFLEDIETRLRSAFGQMDGAEVAKFEQLKESLLISEIITNFEKNEALKFMDFEGNYKTNSYKEMILCCAIKDGRYTVNDLQFQAIPNHKAFYFYDESLPDKSNNGVVYFKDASLAKDFYSRSTVVGRNINQDYSLIKNAAPDCNSMLYIDPYLFSDRTPKQREMKNKRFIEFLNCYIHSNLKMKFHLTILSPMGLPKQMSQDITYFEEEVFLEMYSALKQVNNLYFEIRLCKKLFWENSEKEQDRIFFTNYTNGNMGHPFKNKTYFTQNFIAYTKPIKEYYEEFISDLTHWNRFIEALSDKIDGRKTKYSNEVFTNRLFKNLEY